ncbi:hypothetical protein [Dyadobacter fermentans]|uniref:hypothetical protein n=1 Tax=Dyadobacter fermentans TaxID=94254 RepID=UPI001CBDF073|nr:hypothetical protein [Dyadobacter fermentans]MBZ1357982.1 hypothetical protein [Dyadobacter fermentans]
MAKARKIPEKLTLTKTDLNLIDLGIEILKNNNVRKVDDLTRLKDINERGVAIPGKDLVATTPYVEVAVAVVALTIAVYKAYKSGALANTRVLPTELLQRFKIEHDFSLEQLIDARGEINTMLSR